MAINKNTNYYLSNNDDQQTMIKKINTAIKNMNRSINTVNTTSGGDSGIKYHRELPDIMEEGCHKIESIIGLKEWYTSVNEKLAELEGYIDDIYSGIEEIKDTLEDHEERITALEEG